MKLPLVMNVFYRFFADNFPEPYKPDTRGLYNKLNKILTYGYKNRDIFTAIDFEINSQCNKDIWHSPYFFKIRTDVQKGIFELEMCEKCTGTSALIKVMNID